MLSLCFSSENRMVEQLSGQRQSGGVRRLHRSRSEISKFAHAFLCLVIIGAVRGYHAVPAVLAERDGYAVPSG